MVEVTRLELTTSWSRTKRATKLRYTSESGKIFTAKIIKNCENRLIALYSAYPKDKTVVKL